MVPQTPPDLHDPLALVRHELWAYSTVRESPREPDAEEVPQAFVEQLIERLPYAG